MRSSPSSSGRSRSRVRTPTRWRSASGCPSAVEFATGTATLGRERPARGRAAASLLAERLGLPGLRRQRRQRRRAGRGPRRRRARRREPRDVHGRHRGGRRARAGRAPLPRRHRARPPSWATASSASTSTGRRPDAADTSPSPGRSRRWPPAPRWTARGALGARTPTRRSAGGSAARGEVWAPTSSPRRATATPSRCACSSCSAGAWASGSQRAINIFDPEEVVIGGGAAAGAGDLLLEPARRAAAGYVLSGVGRNRDGHPPRPSWRPGRRARRGAARRAGGRAGDGGGRMRIACGFDHAGFPLKEEVLSVLREEGHEPIDLGTNSTEPVDYPDIAVAVGRAVRDGEAERGVIVCGSGAGRLDRRHQDGRHPLGHGPRHLHRPPGGRARRHERDLPRRARDRARLWPARSCVPSQAPSSRARSATCGGWARSTRSSAPTARRRDREGDRMQSLRRRARRRGRRRGRAPPRCVTTPTGTAMAGARRVRTRPARAIVGDAYEGAVTSPPPTRGVRLADGADGA